MSKDQLSLQHAPEDGASTWEFDEKVAQCFTDMLERSVPNYWLVQKAISYVAQKVPEGAALDLGCSNGNTLELLVNESKLEPIIGIDQSMAMMCEAGDLLAEHETVFVYQADALSYLRKLVEVGEGDYSLVILSLTLQFIPIEHRQEILSRAFKLLKPGGAIILFEKCLGRNHEEEALYTDLYYSFKEEAGYSREMIEKKRKSLENVLVPLPADVNEGLLCNEGFQVHQLCSWCNFYLWVGMK